MSEGTSEMIQRLASVIAYGVGHDLPSRDIALNVLAAMREPTAEMICAGGETLQEHVAMSMHAAVKCWVAMVDASGTAISASPAPVLDLDATTGAEGEPMGTTGHGRSE